MSKKYKLYEITTTVEYELLETFQFKLGEESRYSSSLWCRTDFDIDNDLFEEILIDRINNYRQKKPSFNQINFYNDMCKKLGEEISAPNDYLEFTYRLQQLIERYEIEGPATEKQIQYMHTMWLKATGEKLNAPEVITRGYFKEISDQIREMKKSVK